MGFRIWEVQLVHKISGLLLPVLCFPAKAFILSTYNAFPLLSPGIIDEEVEVTHIQTPSFFFVHTRDNIQKRKALCNKLHRAVTKGKALKKPPVEGNYYVDVLPHTNRTQMWVP